MKPQQFFSELRSSFEGIQYSGLILDDEVKYDEIDKELDQDDHEALVMRLYFLAQDPDKKIQYFINQYDEGKYIYIINVTENTWLFVLSTDGSFAKLHFYIKFILSDEALSFEEETSAEDYKLDEYDQKIMSAKRIQDLLLPNLSMYLRPFKDYHFFYRPKDIVGGDFYWTKESKDHTWIVIGDCTGHSVEGALSSVSVMSILNQVYHDDLEPHWLIKNLHRSLNDMQEHNEATGYGIGLEMIAMKFDFKKGEIHYSGTGLPLYHMSGGSFTQNKTRKSALDPDRIVKFLRSRKRTFKKGDGFFTFSDGLPDQLNEEGKKVKISKINRLLRENNKVDSGLTEQLVDNHRGEEPQTDDIVALYLEV
jgi:hypothetical protein